MTPTVQAWCSPTELQAQILCRQYNTRVGLFCQGVFKIWFDVKIKVIENGGSLQLGSEV